VLAAKGYLSVFSGSFLPELFSYILLTTSDAQQVTITPVASPHDSRTS